MRMFNGEISPCQLGLAYITVNSGAMLHEEKVAKVYVQLTYIDPELTPSSKVKLHQ